MTRRILCSPTCSVCGLVLLAALVIAGLGWVSVASLRVEEEQRRSAAKFVDTNQERLALWRLDSHMLSPLGLENNRPYSHYTALHAPSAIVIDETGSPSVDPGRVPSPLLGADLPDWAMLHVQIDPNKGWQSPQVISAQLADRLTAGPLELNLGNCTQERAAKLGELSMAFPTATFVKKLTEQDRIMPVEDAYIVPVPLADEPAIEKPAPCTDITICWMRDSGESWLVSEAALEHLDRVKAKLGGQTRRAIFCDIEETVQAKNGDKQDALKQVETKEKAAPGLPADQVYPPLATDLLPLPVAPKPRELTPAELERDAVARQQAVNKTMTTRGGYVVSPGRSNSAPAPGQNDQDNGGKQQKDLGSQSFFNGTEQQTIQWIENLTKSIQNRAKDETYKSNDRLGDDKRSLGKTPPDAGRGEAKTGGPAAPGSAPPPPSRGPVDLRNAASLDKFAQSKTATSLLHGFTLSDLSDAKPGPIVAPVAVHIGPMRPRWIADGAGAAHLFILRSVKLGTRIVYQGIAVDWQKLQQELKAELADLFPAGELIPVTGDEAVHDRTMTALPVRLDPGTEARSVLDGWSPLRTGLVIAWLAAIFAIVAVAFGGRAIFQMSERRIRFASAVTHELRTPLTAMQLHLDLLNSGLVQDESKRAEFLATISSEAQRLNQLVENVLDFARLEKRSAQAHARPIAVATILDTIQQTWAERLSSEGFQLVASASAPLAGEVRVDPRVLEQVLGNLIDNARKYAKSAADRRIWLTIKPSATNHVAFEVEDRGPGVEAAERRKIFQPFRRGSSSTDTGGAGLGLSLAKQWAELFGGTLSYRPAEGGTGACFRLELAAV